jgi:hypothetical protein
MPFDWKTRVELKLHELEEARFRRKQSQRVATFDLAIAEEVLAVAPPIEASKANK